MPLHPGVRRPAAHLKQSRSVKTKLEPSANQIDAPAQSSPADPSATGRQGRKRKADSALPDSTTAEPKGTAQADAPEDSLATSSKKSSKPRKAAGKQPAGSKAGQPAGPSKAKGKGRKRKSAAADEDEADLQLQDDIAAVCAASLSEAQPNSGEPSTKAKRLGDIELENQLAMALASTAAEAQHRAKHQPIASQVHSEATLPQSSVHAAKPTLGEAWARSSGIAPQSSQQHEGAAQWAEVYCNSAELGKWVHVDPLRGWLDTPDRVEGSAIRCMSRLRHTVVHAQAQTHCIACAGSDTL